VGLPQGACSATIRAPLAFLNLGDGKKAGWGRPACRRGGGRGVIAFSFAFGT